MAKVWTAEDRDQLRLDAAEKALGAEVAGRSVRDVARELLEIADKGLRARAETHFVDANESHFLNALRDVVETGQTLSDELLAKYHGEWGGDLSRIYDEYSY